MEDYNTQSLWEDMSQEERNEYLNESWEDQQDSNWVRDCDEGDYYSISPTGDTIPW